MGHFYILNHRYFYLETRFLPLQQLDVNVVFGAMLGEMGGLGQSFWGWIKYKSPLMAVLLTFALFISPLIGSVKRAQDAVDLIAFGQGGIVLCLSSHDSSDAFPDQLPHGHHDSECCVLCAFDQGRTAIDVTLFPYAVAYEGIESYLHSYIMLYPSPDIALSDGVFPFDVPARAPPHSAA